MGLEGVLNEGRKIAKKLRHFYQTRETGSNLDIWKHFYLSRTFLDMLNFKGKDFV